MHRKSRIILIAPDKHVHKSCAIQIPTGKHSAGLVRHTNQEYICPGTDLDHGIGNRDLICLMCAKSKFPSGSFKLQNSARWSLKKINKLPGYHKPTIVADLWFLSTRSKERSSTDFPAGAGPGRDISLGGVGELSGVSMDCIAPVSQEYVLVQAS